MAWIESHQELIDHPKTLDLCSLTGWSKDKVIGKLHILWWWALKYAEDGDLSKYESNVSMSLIREDIEPEKMLQMLIQVKFINENGLIHDWLDYAGRYLYSKYHSSNPNKLKGIQKKHKSTRSITYLTTKGNLPTFTNQPTNLNQPTLTNHNISEQVKNLFDSFDSNFQNKITIYLDRITKKNKSGIITDGRKLTLLNELFTSKDRCNNNEIFGYSMDQAINKDACNIGYINAIIKNKKTERPRY